MHYLRRLKKSDLDFTVIVRVVLFYYFPIFILFFRFTSPLASVALIYQAKTMLDYEGKPTLRRKKNIARMIEVRARKAAETRTHPLIDMHLKTPIGKGSNYRIFTA